MSNDAKCSLVLADSVISSGNRYIKILLLLITVLFTVVACVKEPKSFEEEVRHVYQGGRGFFFIKIPPAIITLIMKASDDKEMLEFFNNARQVGIISFGEDIPASQNSEIAKNLEDMLRRYDYEDLLAISDKDKNIIMKIKEKNGKVNELVAIVYQTDSPLIALTLSGEIDVKTIVGMASDFQFDKFLQFQSMGKRIN